MKEFIKILILVSVALINAQENNLIIDYTYSIHMEDLPTTTKINSRLVANRDYSSYEMDFVGNMNFVDEEAGKNGGSVLGLKPKKNPKIYKDYKSRSLYSIERVIMKPFLVKDSMNIFSWSINQNKKEILGYSCQEATTYYRGRDYTAYFTTDIPFQAGPWKFYGLPGLILEVESNDGVIKLNANRINIKKGEIEEIENPFLDIDLEPISWDEYINEYEKKYKELKSYRGQNGTSMSIPKRKIETLISLNSPYLED